MSKRVIALGFFDGVHIGHGALLNMAVRRAAELGAVAAAETFDVHPETIIFGRDMPLINNMADREALMKELYGVDEVIFTHFDETMMKVPWQEFVDEFLVGRYGAIHLVCGHDYRFGYKGVGTAEMLKEYCESRGMGCDIIPKVELDGVTVSSTHIRTLVETGDMETAARFLGHPHRISGTVVDGRKLGRTLGIPTANILIEDGTLQPVHGVYACKAYVDGGVYPAVTNIGVRPTVDDSGAVTVEPYILDFDGDIYGKTLRLDFYRFLRPEQKFASTDELKAAIAKNVQETRDIIASLV